MQGEVVYLYAFDVANEVVTKGLTELLGQKVTPFQLPPDRTLPRDVPLYQPLGIELPAWQGSGGSTVKVRVRVYEVGVINIALHVAFNVSDWHALMPFHDPHLATGQEFDQ